MSDAATQKLKELSQRTDLAVATFAGGCFWCLEAPFESKPGVVDVIAGYTMGAEPDPSYEHVAMGMTGHREAVRVFYDPSQISYQELLDIYWLQIDPTDPGGQFADRGYQYMTVIYYHTDEQEKLAEASKVKLGQSGRYELPIVTQILPATEFYAAEDYHQDFYKKSAERYARYKELSGRGPYIRDMQRKRSA